MFEIGVILPLTKLILGNDRLYPRLNKNQTEALGNIGYTSKKLRSFIEDFLNKKEFKARKRILILSPASCFFESIERRRRTKINAYYEITDLMHEIAEVRDTMVFDSFKICALLNQKNYNNNKQLFDDKFITFFLHDAFCLGLFHSIIYVKCKSIEDDSSENERINESLRLIDKSVIRLLNDHPRSPKYTVYENLGEAKQAKIKETLSLVF